MARKRKKDAQTKSKRVRLKLRYRGYERANSGSLKEEAALHGPGEILFVRHEGNHRQRGQLGESCKLFRRAYRMVERFRGGAGG